MSSYILDTNVWLVASDQDDCLQCQEACMEIMKIIRETASAKVVFDFASFHEQVPGNSVLQELKQNLKEGSYSHTLFWTDIFRNIPQKMDLIELQYDDKGAIIPNGIQINQVEPNGKLNAFEPNDRKWIALHLLHPDHPVIHNAADGDWEKARADLTRHGIKVRQLCTGEDI